ncbi:alpha/beta fold hydrolase [bacterium]|nr:alpha/beta fold hydrolase [bacterium]
MPSVRVGDVDLYYELIDCTEPWRAGAPPAVLLHGLGTDRRLWLYQVPAFCGRVPTLLVDLRGHGRSRGPSGEWTVAEMARDVVRLLRSLGVEKAHLVGLSLGGMVAQQLALDYPYATASLALADTIAGPRPGERQRLAEALAFIDGHDMRQIAEARLTTAFSESVDPLLRRHFIEQVALNDKATYGRAARAAFSFDVRDRLAEIAAPTLVLIGDADRTFPMPWMEDVADGIRGARTVRLAGAGHLSNLERPQDFNRAVLDFLGV